MRIGAWTRGVPTQRGLVAPVMAAALLVLGAGMAAAADPAPAADTSADTPVAGIDWRSASVHPQFHDFVATSDGLIAVGEDPRGGVVWMRDVAGAWREEDAGPDLDGDALRAAAVVGDSIVAVGCRGVRTGCAPPGIWIRDASQTDRWPWHEVSTRKAIGRASIADVTASDDLVVAVGADQEGAAIWTSPDGVRWSRVRDLPEARGARIEAVAVGPAGFVAVGGQRDGKPMSWTTADGSSWLAGGPEAPRGALRAVIEHDGAYLAAGWTASPDAAEASSPVAWRSTDGLVWSPLGLIPGAGELSEIAVGPAGIVLLDSDGAAYHSTDGSSWQAASAPLAGAEAITGDGPGFVAGGLSALWSSPSDVVGLPESQASIEADADWVPIGMMPRLTPGFTAASGAGRATYFFSETEPKGALRVDKFDPLTGEWTRLKTIRAGVTAPEAATGPGGLIYVVGLASDQRSGRMGVYDSARGRWTRLPDPPLGRRDPGVIVSRDRSLYVIGGQVGSGTGRHAVARVDRYVPSTKTWSQAPAMPAPATDPGVAPVRSGPGFYVFLDERVWTFGATKNEWIAGPAALVYGTTREPTTGNDGRIRVFDCAHFDIYDPDEDRWLPGAPLTSERCVAAVEPGSDGDIVAFGDTVPTGTGSRTVEAVDTGRGGQLYRSFRPIAPPGGFG